MPKTPPKRPKIIRLPPGPGVHTKPNGEPLSRRQIERNNVLLRSQTLYHLLVLEQRKRRMSYFMRYFGIESPSAFERSEWHKALMMLVDQGQVQIEYDEDCEPVFYVRKALNRGKRTFHRYVI